ncbi:uncharacterized protein STEHIDRAFT_163232 [Stereum hirsutum FP-91666 SS1]|uniref:Hydrophobin n=1 Tax=Stereum hirsutum (strain FP-91666) TaxID=721885 RepID=R7RYR8_STEHR|nr:uncharacterized protein STEHIDRAFT_163232 [Stereum hirsutum FP-91666 SS1]EIM79978.1 hypothetical protein STEHIDRAFT_163232 [Stereum hirsutum FP-91666 SS1]
MSSVALCVVYLTIMNVANASLLRRGDPEICTDALDGSGCANYQVTKDCCAAVNQKAYFNEVSTECWPYSGPAGNSVDTGAMVKCCSSRGKGSSATNYGSAPVC